MELFPVLRLLLCSVLIFGIYQQGVEAQSQPCTLPNTRSGSCVAIHRCRNIYNIINNPSDKNKQFEPYIKKAACTLPGIERSICCSPSEIVRESTRTSTTPRTRTCNKQNLLPSDCGRIATDRISYGNVTKVFENPWMAVLRYRSNGNVEDRCAGSLINKRYVLTAAHCIKTRSAFDLHSVVLGEHTKNQDEDCNVYRNNNDEELDRDCAGPIEEFGIESFVIHEDYNRPTQRNDIGLIRLNRDVRMKDHIKPICLPTTEALRTQSFQKYIVTGWGATENSSGSNALLQANLNHVERRTCQQKLQSLRQNIVLSDRQICAQGKELVDSCSGDSGGPLIFSASYGKSGARFVQLGIVSSGVDSCGQKSAPGIYSRVASYMDWILSKLECDG